MQQEKYGDETIWWHSLFDRQDIVALHEAANEKRAYRIRTIDLIVEKLKGKYPKRFRKDDSQKARTAV